MEPCAELLNALRNKDTSTLNSVIESTECPEHMPQEHLVDLFGFLTKKMQQSPSKKALSWVHELSSKHGHLLIQSENLKQQITKLLESFTDKTATLEKLYKLKGKLEGNLSRTEGPGVSNEMEIEEEETSSDASIEEITHYEEFSD